MFRNLTGRDRRWSRKRQAKKTQDKTSGEFKERRRETQTNRMAIGMAVAFVEMTRSRQGKRGAKKNGKAGTQQGDQGHVFGEHWGTQPG